MQEKKDKKSEDSYKVAAALVEALRLDIKESDIEKLSQCKKTLLSLIVNYCKHVHIDEAKLKSVLDDYNNSEPVDCSLQHLILHWPAKPIRIYIQQTSEGQFCAPYREGYKKSGLLALLLNLFTELMRIDDLDDLIKLDLTYALFKEIKKDRIWESGNNGIKALEMCAEQFDFIKRVQDKPEKLLLLAVVCTIATIISNYRTHVNEQTTPSYVTFGWFIRQGELNLSCFNQYLDDISAIAQSEDYTFLEAIALMSKKLTQVEALIKGPRSSKTCQEIKETLETTKEKNLKMVSDEIETIQQGRHAAGSSIRYPSPV